MSRKTLLLLTLFSGFLLTFCTRTTETMDNPEFSEEKLAELMPLAQGKYITYRLDSIVPIRQGRALETRRYQIKDVVDTIITDVLGRPSYRVFRYRNDSLARGSWEPMATYFITQMGKKIEVVENNLRTVKLQLPLRPDATWKGNSYLPDGAYGAFNDARLNEVWNWDFVHNGWSQERIGRNNFDSVWTVQHLNEIADTVSIPAGSTSPHHGFYIIGYSEEKFVPRVGLVARQLLAIENEPNKLDADNYDPYRIGFGIRMWMIDHN